MDLLSFFTLLTAFLGFAAITAANPLQAREDTRATATSIASTMPTGVSALPANVPIPTGYTWGKLLYNTTIHGHSKQFSGHGMDDIYYQVAAQYPDFNPKNATSNKTPYPDFDGDNDGHTYSDVESRAVEGGIVQGSDWHAYCNPVPGQNWGGGAKSQDSHLALTHFEGDYNVVAIQARSCVMFSCWVQAGWTICNDNPYPIQTTVDNFARFGLVKLDDWPQGPNCCFWGWDDQERCGGQIFNQPQAFNMILREGFGCG